jgi:N-acylneuraminate cytidylyltransferase
MNGKPLAAWTIEAARECPEIYKVYVGIDSVRVWNAITDYQDYNVEFIRVNEMDDHCVQETPMMELADKVDFDRIVLMQATQPLTTSGDLTGGLKKHFNEGVDSVVSVCRQHRFIWERAWGTFRSPTYDPLARPRRQDWEGLWVENGAFFITTREAFMKTKCRISGHIGLYEMDPITYFDIDEPEDWDVMEMLLKRREHAN